jgi:hypothetical protein
MAKEYGLILLVMNGMLLKQILVIKNGLKKQTYKPIYLKIMKLKRTRRERTCHECKKTILKNDSYGQRSITLGSKQDGQAETFDGHAIIVHQMRIKVDICQECAA